MAEVYFGQFRAISADVTLSRGTSPSVFVVRVGGEEAANVTTGTLVLRTDSGQITFQDCAVRNAPTHVARTRPMSLQILDRRWRWQWPRISGRYNVRREDGLLRGDSLADPFQKKTARELASLLLEAMGETNYDVSQVSSQVYPEADWQDAIAARELQRLCDRLGCVVCLGLDNVVRIQHKGQGQTMPRGEEITPHYPYVSHANPSRVVAAAGPTVFQSLLTLQAVGMETDGSLVPLDELSYKPDGGWEGEWYQAFSTVADNRRHLAFQSIYRYYRVVAQASGGIAPAGYDGTIGSVEQIVLRDVLAEVGSDQRAIEPRVYGLHWSKGLDGTNFGEMTEYVGKFRVLPEQQCIEFGEPVVKLASDGYTVEPTLYLLASYFLLDDDGVLVRHSKSRDVDTGAAGEQVVRIPEIHRVVRQPYSTSGSGASVTLDFGAFTTNEEEIDPELQEYAYQVSTSYDGGWAEDVVYGGLRRVETDGVIAQVRWTVSTTEPTRTRIGRMMDCDITAPGDRQQRQAEEADWTRYA